MAAAVEPKGEGSAVAGGGRGEVDSAAKGAGAISEGVGAAGHGDVTRRQGIDDAVVVVAVGGGDRQAVLEKLDAVFVVVGRVEVGSPAGQEQLIAAERAFSPNAGNVTQQLGKPGHRSFVGLCAVDERNTAGGSGPPLFGFGLGLPGSDVDTFVDGFNRRGRCLRRRFDGGRLGCAQAWRGP